MKGQKTDALAHFQGQLQRAVPKSRKASPWAHLAASPTIQDAGEPETCQDRPQASVLEGNVGAQVGPALGFIPCCHLLKFLVFEAGVPNCHLHQLHKLCL